MQEEWVTNKEEGTGNRRPVLDSRLGFSPMRMTEEVDGTLASLMVFLPSLNSVMELNTMNRNTLHRIPATVNVVNNQQQDDCQSPLKDCPDFGAKGNKIHSDDACLARNKEFFNCGAKGHYKRACRKPEKQSQETTKVMAAGRVDEEVLEKLDKGLARKLKFEYNFPGQN